MFSCNRDHLLRFSYRQEREARACCVVGVAVFIDRIGVDLRYTKYKRNTFAFEDDARNDDLTMLNIEFRKKKVLPLRPRDRK